MNKLDIFKNHPLILKKIKERCKSENKFNDMKKSLGNGFAFANTDEGHSFWFKILFKLEIDHFYERYPKDTNKLD